MATPPEFQYSQYFASCISDLNNKITSAQADLAGCEARIKNLIKEKDWHQFDEDRRIYNQLEKDLEGAHQTKSKMEQKLHYLRCSLPYCDMHTKLLESELCFRAGPWC